MENIEIQDLINRGYDLLKLKPQSIDPYCNPLDYMLNSNNSRSSVVYSQSDFTLKCDAWINDVKKKVKDLDQIATVSFITENIIEEYANAVKKIIHYLKNL